jgi:hypothetical protein
MSLTGAAGFASYFVYFFNNGMSSTLGAINAFSSLVSSSSARVNGPLLDAVNAAKGATDRLVAAASTAGDPLVLSAAQDVAAAMAASVTATQSLGLTLSSGRDALSSALCLVKSSSCPVDASTARLYVSYGVWAILGGGAAAALIHGVFLMKNRCAALVFRCTAPCMLIVGVLTPLLGAAFFAVALAGSDFCVAPAASLSSVLNVTSPLVSATLSYAAACGVAGGAPVAPVGASAQAVSAVDSLQAAIAKIYALNATVASSPVFNGLLIPLGDITYSLRLANASASSLAADVSCAPTATIYFSLLNGVCTGAVSSAAKTLFSIGGAVAAVFGVLLASVRACWRESHSTAAPAS